jgi:non-ribosomal peptide synthetase component E (peptide arylation enzyme)
MAHEKLTPCEVPKVIEIREELPLAAVGKVDKKILRKENR